MSRPRPDVRARGQAMAEFALVAPIFFLLMFGLIELGRAVFYTQILDSATRDGARYAIVHGFQSFCPSGPMPGGVASCDPTGQNVITTVRDRSIGVTDKLSDLLVNVKWCDSSPYQADSCGDFESATNTPVPCSAWADLGDGDNGRSQLVTVCVQYSYDALLGFLPIPDFTVTGRATLVVNN